MTRRDELIYLAGLFLALCLCSYSTAMVAFDVSAHAAYETPAPPPTVTVEQPEPVAKPVPTPSPEPVAEEEPEWVCPLTDEEVELIALLTMAEAEGEPEEGQRLVIDTVLNRVDSPYFPDTVHEVVYQKNQYAGMYGERVERCYIKEELCQLVREELRERTNSEVVFFRTKHYHSYGVPLFQVGNHYFSKYN